MTLIVELHPVTPQKRHLQSLADTVRRGEVLAYPTDAGYALGCALDSREGLRRICQIRALPEDHHFTLMCRDLSEISQYALVSDGNYRILKRETPGPFTFILPATRDVPKKLQHPKKKTIGLRIPDHPVAQGLLELVGTPLLTTSMILPGQREPITDPALLADQLKKRIEAIALCGEGSSTPTTLIDMTGPRPVLLRQGRGEAPWALAGDD